MPGDALIALLALALLGCVLWIRHLYERIDQRPRALVEGSPTTLVDGSPYCAPCGLASSVTTWGKSSNDLLPCTSCGQPTISRLWRAG